MLGISEYCKYWHPTTPVTRSVEAAVPLMSTRVRQISDGGLHLQSQEQQQRGDLALSRLIGSTSSTNLHRLHAQAPPPSVRRRHRGGSGQQGAAEHQSAKMAAGKYVPP